ncbi:AraC family transcriptional regulator [candidate division KSB1 bacterium]|nr:AraC family transcriptional regulator [candidate division KSB1 bacterium]
MSVFHQFKEELNFKSEPIWAIETDGYGPFRGLHMHNGLEFGSVFRGEGSINLNGTEHALEVGDIFFFDPSIPHWHMNAPESRLNMYIVMFPTTLVQSFSYHITDVRLLKPFLAVRRGFPPVLKNRPDLVEVMHDIVKLYEKQDKHWDLRIVPKMAQVLVSIADATLAQINESKKLFSLQASLIAQALYYINLHYHEQFKVDILASLCNLSTSRFSHLFTEIVGQSPLQYRDELRIAYAIERMSSSDETLSRIAGESGFTDSVQFSRIFKKVTGFLPAEYRKNLRQ